MKFEIFSREIFTSNLDIEEISYELPPLIPQENVFRDVDLDIVPWKINRFINRKLPNVRKFRSLQDVLSSCLKKQSYILLLVLSSPQ